MLRILLELSQLTLVLLGKHNVMRLKTCDFDFNLPPELIAQIPASPRDHSRLFVYDTTTDTVYHRHFFDLPDYFNKGDVIVVNRSRVIPARILFKSNYKECEIFVLKKQSSSVLNVLVRPGSFFKIDKTFFIDKVSCKVVRILDDGTRDVEICTDDIDAFIEKYGSTPLPPYIKNTTSDPERYQTVYSNEAGSVAAPTAGLHFTNNLISTIKDNGVLIEEVILHVGRGTFLPVTSEFVEDHKMHFESFTLSEPVASSVASAKASGSIVCAVGTTSVRVLESCHKNGLISSGSGETDIFIIPGLFQWNVVDRLLTNFHLPKSTLIMLVASFLESKGIANSREKILDIYNTAIRDGYRFYSFGDAMLIL